MLVDSIYDGKSAAEILEETKKYYVKTRELKENKIGEFFEKKNLLQIFIFN